MVKVRRLPCCSYLCHATLRRYLRPTHCRLRFVARLCRGCSRPALSRHKRGFYARAIPDIRLLNPSRSHPDPYNFLPQTRKRPYLGGIFHLNRNPNLDLNLLVETDWPRKIAQNTKKYGLCCHFPLCALCALSRQASQLLILV
jgi:hypothetical protein